MATTKKAASDGTSYVALATPPVIVDLGQKARKKISRLKKGEGPLYEDLCETVAALQEDGVVAKDVQVVIAVVQTLPDGSLFPKLVWN
jgi:hypothetical protein